jgi:tRNA uracil 4-sulfurtransferase
MRKPIIVIHYGEIALKGKNRGIFEKRLFRNVQRSLREIGCIPGLERVNGRFILFLQKHSGDSVPRERILQRLIETPGITYCGVGFEVGCTIEEIIDGVIALCVDLPAGSFKVDTRRSDKSFPLTSPEVSRRVGQAVVDRFKLGVNLNNPDIVIRIEIAFSGVYIFCSRYRGIGGLPVGMSGNVVSLLSAGFDSPVASYLMIKRGARVYFAHFHSHPYVSRNSIDQVHSLVKRLSDFQHESICYMVPIAEIQKKIITVAPHQYRVLLYRRAMVRLAERIAGRHKCEALVTGESLGQVASQTLRNIRVVDESASLPILRPLVGMDKEEIIALSRTIDTESISAEPYDDCCAFLMPRRVETWGSIDVVREIESNLDCELEYDEALSGAEKLLIRNRYRDEPTDVYK